MKTLVLGAGRMGRRHVQVVQKMKLDLVGLVDQMPAALEQSAQELGLAKSQLFTDVAAGLAEKPRCVIVSTTAPAHAEYAIAAARAGVRYILCEKPLATSLQACDQVLAACREAGAHLAVNHQMRFMEQYAAPKKMLNSPEFGGLRSVSVTTGNFGLAMNATHYFEMFRYMADAVPTEAAAWFSPEKIPNPRGPQFEDRAGCVRLTTASGVRFYLDCSADQGHGMHVTYAARHGWITVDELGGQMRWAVRNAEHRGQPTTRYGMPWTDGHRAIAPADALTPTQAVLDSLLSGGDYPTGEHGRLAVAVLVAATLSAEGNHAPVPIAEADKHAGRVFPWA